MPNRKVAKVAAVAFASVLATGCVIYLATKLEWSEPLKLVRKAHLLALVGATFCLHFAYICVRTLRWQAIIRDKNPDIGFGDLYWITAIAVSLAIVTPGQIGEAVKVELLKRRGLGGRLAGLGSFALERVLDVLAIAGFTLVGLAFDNAISTRYPQVLVVAAILGVLGLVFLYVFRPAHPTGTSLGWIALLRSGTGTSMIKLRMFALTLVSWCLVGAGWQVCLQAVGVDISLAAVCWLISLVTLGTLLSLVPAGVGVADLVVVQVLIGIGVPQAEAQAGALILRFYAMVTIFFGCCHLVLWPFLSRGLRGRTP